MRGNRYPVHIIYQGSSELAFGLGPEPPEMGGPHRKPPEARSGANLPLKNTPVAKQTIAVNQGLAEAAYTSLTP